MLELRSALAEILVCQDACSSQEEAEVMVEIILEDHGDDEIEENFSAMQDLLVENLIDNLGIEETQAKTIFQELKRSNGYASTDEGETDGSEEDDTSVESFNDSDEDDDTEYLRDGECELCDRFIRLSRHHLIPKSTWPRMKVKLLQAAILQESGDREKSSIILGDGLEDLLGDEINGRSRAESGLVLSSDKATVRAILHTTCDICRQCHSTVHRTHSNMELALNYNSVGKLLQDKQISKFCKWASKQKPGRYKRR